MYVRLTPFCSDTFYGHGTKQRMHWFVGCAQLAHGGRQQGTNDAAKDVAIVVVLAFHDHVGRP
jgi:hypothetical protein